MIIIVLIILNYLLYKLAEDYKRNGFIWCIVGVIVTPIMAIIMLIIIGEKKKDETIP